MKKPVRCKRQRRLRGHFVALEGTGVAHIHGFKADDHYGGATDSVAGERQGSSKSEAQMVDDKAPGDVVRCY